MLLLKIFETLVMQAYCFTLYNNNTVSDTEKYYNNTRGYYNITLINYSNVLDTAENKIYRHVFC